MRAHIPSGRTRLGLALLALLLLAPGSLAACGGAPDRRLPPGASARERPRWAPPVLTAPETVEVSDQHATLKLDPRRDYVLKMPSQALRNPGGLVVVGGHNVVLIGGEINIGWQGRHARPLLRRGLYLTNQTGTVHVEGLRITGKDLGEGIDLDQRSGATVQLVNLRIDTVRARDERHFTDTHPDLIQTWAGPRRLRIDGLTGRTGYQGLFLLPTQYDKRLRPREVDLRNIAISGTRRSGYLLWRSRDYHPRLRNVWLRAPVARGSYVMWPHPSAWRGVRRSRRPRARLPHRPAPGLAYPDVPLRTR